VGRLGWPLGDHYLLKPTPYFSPRLDPSLPYYSDLRVQASSSGLVFHDPEANTVSYAWKRPASSRRVVCIGDSITQVWPGQSNYTHALADALSEDLEVPVEVIPLGLGGYTPEIAMEAYADWARSLNPDLLLLQLGPNDVDSIRLEPAPARLSSGHWPSRQLRGRNHKKPAEAPVSHAAWWMEFAIHSMLGGDRNHGLELTGRPVQLQRGIEAFRNLAAELAIPGVAVVFPFFENRHTPLESELILATLQEHQIDAWDLSESLGKGSLGPLSSDGIHPDDRAHMLAGTAIARYLKKYLEGP
jgi:lysophospholipase L1-like esterase